MPLVVSDFPNLTPKKILSPRGIREEHRENLLCIGYGYTRINELTGAIVSSAMKVHSFLGPGLLESAYQACLAQELRSRGFEVITEVAMPVVYEGQKLEVGYRIDLSLNTESL